MTIQPTTQQLPDIPKAVNWASTLLILSAIPWFTVFTDNVLSAPVIALRVEFPAHSHEAMLLLSIGYLMLAVSVLNGYQWTRITVVVATVGFNLFMLNSAAGLSHAGESEVGTASFELMMLAWTVVLSSTGLVLLYTPASSTYIAQSEAYQAYLDPRLASIVAHPPGCEKGCCGRGRGWLPISGPGGDRRSAVWIRTRRPHARTSGRSEAHPRRFARSSCRIRTETADPT